MILDPTFKFRQLSQDVAVPGDGAAHPHKRQDDKDAHFDGVFGISAEVHA
jgi:hypothetical protein